MMMSMRKLANHPLLLRYHYGEEKVGHPYAQAAVGRSWGYVFSKTDFIDSTFLD